MNYITIRTSDGRLKAKLAGHHLTRFMNDVNGHWGKIQWEGEPRKTCLYIDEPAEYVTTNATGFMAIWLSEGDIVEECRT